MNSDKRRIIVTGATGFLGRRLVGRLLQDGHEVVAFVRDPERARAVLPQSTELVAWSHADGDGAWRGHVDGADGIVNLAGAPIGVRWTERAKRDAYDSRILGTRHIVQAIAAAGQRPAVLVNASAVGYYGISPSGPVTEQTPPGDDFVARLCQDWEREALQARELGLRVALVRTGVVLHPKEGALKRMLLPFRFFIGGPIGSGRQPVPWIHVDDELEIFLWALREQRVDGPVNAAAPEYASNRELARELGRVLHRPSFFPAPELAVRIVLGEGATIVTEGQQVVPERTQALGFRFRHPRLSEALEDLFVK